MLASFHSGTFIVTKATGAIINVEIIFYLVTSWLLLDTHYLPMSHLLLDTQYYQCVIYF